MNTVMYIDYDCGFKVCQEIALEEGELLLANSRLGKQMLSMADSLHNRECVICKFLNDEPIRTE